VSKTQFNSNLTLDFIITVCGAVQGTIIDEEIWENSGNQAYD